MGNTFYRGSAGIDKVYLGSTAVDALYLGATKVWARDPLAGVNIGDPFMGGYYAGIIDTTVAGSIPVNDASQSGLRYALIVSPKSMETTSTQYKTANNAAPTASHTVWEGLAATQAMNSASYPAAQSVSAITYPSDGASQWYLPAMWELLAVYWTLKPTMDANYLTATTGSTFPGGTVTQGVDTVSDPQRPAFTASVPTQTTVAVFRAGGGQQFESGYYWTATEYDAASAWILGFGGASAGRFAGPGKSNSNSVRPFRRLPL